MRMLFVWFLLSISWWLAGYLGARDKDNYLDKVRFRCLKSHPIIYFICGSPKASNIPAGVLVVNLVWRQLYGILLIVYGLFLDGYITLLSEKSLSNYLEISPQFISFAVGCLGTFALSGLIAYGVYKISPYNG